MKLPEQHRVALADEIAYVLREMNSEPNPRVQLYLFSGIHGEAGRILNYYWDAELGLLHHMLQAVHGSATSRLQAIVTNIDVGVDIPETFMPALIEAAADLERVLRLNQDDRILGILARFAELTYLTTGNGYYLYRKGAIKI